MPAASALRKSWLSVERDAPSRWATSQAVRTWPRISLSPSTADVLSVAEAGEGAGADALTVANTLPGMRIDTERMVALLFSFRLM